MSWLYEVIERESPLNHRIIATRLLGRWEVIADGGFQTTPYVTGLWANAITRIPRTGIKRILLLGLGAGGLVKCVRRRFPSAQMTAIEWDPVMVELSEKLGLFSAQHRLRILTGDVRRILPTLDQQFDLILCDIFQGRRAASLIGESSFLEALKPRLARDGYLVVNTYKRAEQLSDIDRVYSRHATWRYKMNDVALYRHIGQGKVGDPLPEGYTHFRGVDAYVIREGSNGSPWHPVGRSGCMGARWHYGPLYFEGYQTDIEPQIDSSGPHRMITWQPFSQLPKPTGWHRSWAEPGIRLTGFAEIQDPENYWFTWAPHAQRHRLKWLHTQPYALQSISYEEFVCAYQTARMGTWLKRLSLGLVANKVKRHGSLVDFFGARDPRTGRLVAGFAAVDIPEADQSFHLASFILQEAKHASVGTGLVDAWFQRGIEKGFRFLDFDLFYAPGDPRSWKGFSRFKGQFGITYIKYPKPFIRFI